MKRLIIAEKPSLGKNIANAIGKASFINKDGYMESNEYIVTWAYGHLFTQEDICAPVRSKGRRPYGKAAYRERPQQYGYNTRLSALLSG